MYAQVIVDILHENVAHVFTYAIPQDMHLEKGHRVLVPFGPRKIEGVVLDITEETTLPPEKIKAVLRPLEAYPAILPSLVELAQSMAQAAHCPLAETLRLMLPAAMRGGRIKEKTELVATLRIPRENLDEAIFANKRSSKKTTILSILSDGAPHSLQTIKLLVRDPHDALRDLEKKELITLSYQEVLRSPYGEMEAKQTEGPPLMPEQEEALSEMVPALHEGRGVFLLHGVTGSGKTEVYMRLVEEALSLGKGAIILVPEIALTPQMVHWFRQRFGPVAAVLHSRLSDGERFDEWRRIRKGAARVVIGARSAVFAPVERLGLIVVDEEHEQSYISDKHPRYDARDIAKERGSREGAAVLLSSATPSILSFARARRGDYTLLEMPVRVMNRPMPTVHLVDMRKELAGGNRSIFSALLTARLGECLAAGQQAILFLNRRGYSPFVSCRSCGYVVKCAQCDVSMTFHREPGDGNLHCHYCGQVEAPPKVCPQCGSEYIRYFGIGTQRVEEEVHKLFPGVGVLRMDNDTVSGKDGHYHLLNKFRAREAQVLVGTQMIAKGLDFPAVTLVGVIAADMTLNLPDYRAQERTFQLLTQVAGRAGRADDPGQVVVQTYKPEHPCIETAAAQDYRAFFEAEFQRRRKGLYPPFTALSRLLVEGPAEAEAKDISLALAGEMETFLASEPTLAKQVLMMRQDAAPVKMIRGKHRFHVLIKLLAGEKGKAVTDFATDLAEKWPLPPGYHIYFELNPATMI